MWTALTDPRRLRRISFGLVFALAVSMAIIVATGSGPWGDFNVFWEVGWIVRDDPRLLLDASVQEARVREWYDNATAPFPYPPAAGFAMVPLTWLPLDAAYLATMAVLAILAGFSARLLCDVLGVTNPVWRQVAVAATVAFAPVVRAFVSGQNATITLFALALGWWLRDRGHPAWAGVALGILWYKPQFAIPVLLLVLVGRWFATAAGMAVAAAASYAFHAWQFGGDWIVTWYRELVAARDVANQLNELAKTASLVEYVRAAAGDVPGYGLALALGLLAAWLFVRHEDPADRLAITCVALVVTAPHALSYEATLLVPVLGLVAVRGGRGMLPWGILGWLLGLVTLGSTRPLLTIGYVLIVAATWWWARDTGVPDRGTKVAVAQG